MALITNIETPSGVVGGYLKISGIQAETGMVGIEVYFDEAARRAGKLPLMAAGIQVDPGIFSEENLKREGNTAKVVAYQAIAETGDYISDE